MDNLLLQAVVMNVGEAEAAAVQQRRQFIRNEYPFATVSHRLFVKNFRLPKNVVRNLLNEVDDFLLPPTRVSAISKTTKVLIILNFLATGSYQTVIGNNVHCSGVSQATVSRWVEEVVQALNNPVVFNRWVKFPGTMEELRQNRRLFFEKHNIPGVVGVIDCTHIAIFPPPANYALHPEHIYVNRKQYHSLNVQLICDSNLKIINVNARFPGSTHDSYIWNSSAVLPQMVNLSRRQAGFFLIGDSGYMP